MASQEELTRVALNRTDKTLDALDRMMVRVWMDGYKYALSERGLITEGTPTPAYTPPPTPKPKSFQPDEPPTPAEPSSLYEIPTEALQQGWRKVYHNRGEYPCGRAALIVTRPVYSDEKSSVDLLRYVNGKKVSAQDEPLCGSCRKPIDPYSNADLDWAAHMLPPRKNYAVSFNDEWRTQSEPGPDSNLGTDPAQGRHPASVLAEMNKGFSLAPEAIIEDHLKNATSMYDEDIEAVSKLYDEIGLERPQSFLTAVDDANEDSSDR